MNRKLRSPYLCTCALALAAIVCLTGTNAVASANLRAAGPKPLPNDDGAYAGAVSSDGTKLFVTGYSEGDEMTGWDYATVAYDATTGTKLWVRRYDGLGGDEDYGASVAVAPDATRLFVTGTSFNGSSRDYATIAYSAVTGAELWIAQYDGPANNRDLANSVAVSGDGTRVFVTGTSFGGSRTTDFDYATVAYDASSGDQVWAARYDGPGNGKDYGRSIAVSDDGTRVFVTGMSFGGRPTRFDYATVAYDAATGAQLWVARYDGPAAARDEASSLGLGPDGTKVFVTGTSFGGKTTGSDYATVAYDGATGAQLWVARYDGSEDAGDEGINSLDVSEDGKNVFVAGNSDDGYGTVAYDASTGAQLWFARYPTKDEDFGSPIAIRSAGTKVFVTGDSFSGADFGYATVAYEATTGAQAWAAHYTGPGGDDSAWSLAVTRDRAKVFVTGESDGGPTGSDYGTVAYDAATGARRWTARYTNGPANCIVPLVRTFRVEAAKAKIRRAHCSVGRIERAYSHVAKGRVLSQSPRAGTRLRASATVRLVVSRGPRPNRHHRE